MCLKYGSNGDIEIGGIDHSYKRFQLLPVDVLFFNSK